MININLSNMIGASSSVQSEPISTDASSTCLDFMSELKLELENNGDISNKTDDVDEGMMLYNYIYELYQKFNIQEDIVDSEKLELDNTLLDSNDIKEVIDYINNYIDEYKNISDKEELNKQFDLLVDKIKERLEAYEKSNNDIAIYEKLDSIGALNMLKIDDFNNSKNEDMDCLENILASDNNYTNSIVGFNKFSTVYNTNVNVEIEQPVSEIRQEFISDDIVKAVKYIKSNDMESLNVKFNPKDLGEISINISKNNEESNLLITVDDNNVFDFVNNNIEDIKNHLKDTNIDIKDVFITVKSDNENLFSDNLNRGFNQESNFKQNKNNKSKKDNQEIIDDLTINDYNNADENLNILI